MDAGTERLATAASAPAMLPRPYRVLANHADTHDTVTLEMVPVGGGARADACRRCRPGQFNMLYAFGVGEVPVSISGDTGERSRLVHTVRGVGAVSEALCRLRPGDSLGVRGPFGSPWPVTEAEGHDVALVAGGIGLAPLRPALYHLLANRERYGRVALLYGARSPQEILYIDELRRWRGRLDMDVLVTVDRATENWRGAVGFVTKLVRRVELDAAGAVALVCGPELMMRYAAQELLGLGLKPERVHVSLERNMKCGVGLCGHCQLGPIFVCRDGPVAPFEAVRGLLQTAEL